MPHQPVEWYEILKWDRVLKTWPHDHDYLESLTGKQCLGRAHGAWLANER